MEHNALFPGNSIGIIGDGPNGIGIAQAAKKLGLKVIVYATNEGSPTLNEADVKMVGTYNDKTKLQDFAERSDVVTYESESISADLIRYLSRFTNIPQGFDTLEIVQDRLLERAMLEDLNINIAPYATIVSLDDIYQAVGSIGYPCVLKPIQKFFGSNKKQIIKRQTDIAKCAEFIDKGTYILESWIPHEKELSVSITRNVDGVISFFPIVETVYRDGKLEKTIVPAGLAKEVITEVRSIVSNIVTNLNYVGLLEVSLYLTKTGSLYVKSVVPTIHQAGYVFEKAANVSVFEQHLRTIIDMPVGRVKLLQPIGMVMIDEPSIEAVMTQWVLKDNWSYTFFRYPESMNPKVEGYILVQGDSAEAIKQQIASTGIWDKE